MALYPVTWKTQFARAVSQGTGLNFEVVLGWVQAEGGKPTNPLNIGPGRDYGSPQNAAAATVALLHTSRYAPVLAAARTGNEEAQIRAIVASPWDAGHYRNGTLLRGAIAAVRHQAAQPASPPIPGYSTVIPPGAGQFDLPGLPDVGDWVSGLTSWIGEHVALALAYVVLTLAATALFVLGVMRTAGTSPLELARSAGAARAAGGQFPKGY